MRRFVSIAFASAILAFAGDARGASALPDMLNVLGSVTNAARPVANALVIALNVNNLEASQTFTAPDGSFTLPLLPASVYKIIAVKYGFAPASATIVPNRKDQRLALRMQSERRAGKNANQEIWEIRGSLPPDVLHDIDMAMAPPVEVAVTNPDTTPRLRAQMMSMTGMAQTANPSFAQTALGVQSRIVGDWQIGFQGNLHRIENPVDEERFGEPMAESKAMQMELRSSATDSYRLASTKSFWRYRNDVPVAKRQADVRTHNFEWQHGESNVQVRYFEQQNLFGANPDSNFIEVAGNTTVFQTARTDFGVALRVTQENVRNVVNATFRTADMTTTGKLEIVPSFSVRYGVTSRLGIYGTEFAPRTGAEWKVGKETALVFNGLHKVYDQERQNMTPTVVVWSDESRVLPRYSYSFGIVSGKPESADRVSAIVTISAADSPLRVVFSDGFEGYWDGLYVDTGDIRRDLRVAYRKELGTKFLVDVSSSAGMARPPVTAIIHGDKVYVTGDVASTFNPTGTTFAISYRSLHQPQSSGSATEYRSERMNVRLAQSLHLPFDLRVLVGMELAHIENSPYLFDAFGADGPSKKYIGGLAVNF